MRIIDKTATQVRSLTPAEEELLVGFAPAASPARACYRPTSY